MELELTLTGTRPLLMHSERLANPLDPLAKQLKAITSKRSKTEDDFAAAARVEFEGGLYLGTTGAPVFPTWNIKRSIQDGAKINKLGTHVMRAFEPIEIDVPLEYGKKAPKTVQSLWDAGFYDVRSVVVGQSKVQRCRPMFLDWSLSFTADLDTEVLDLDRFVQCANRAGAMIGIGDFRQRFGRYDVIVKEID